MKINDSFIISSTLTNKIIDIKKYSLVTDEFLDDLRQKNKNKNISIYCGCSDKLEMSIAKKSHLYLYPKTRSLKHTEYCVRQPNYEGSSPYEKAWSTDEESGMEVVRIGGLIPSESLDTADDEEISDNKIYVINSSPNSKRKSKATIFGLATKMNMMAWKNMTTGKKQIPEDLNEMARQVFGVSRKIILSNRKASLQDIFKSNPKVGGIKVRKDVLFIYVRYINEHPIEQEKLQNGLTKYVVFGETAFQKESGFYIEPTDFQEKLYNEPHSDIHIIAGFAFKNHESDNKLTLGKYCVFPVSERGLFVESSYEKVVYDFLCDNNRLFYKPYVPVIDEYEQFIPDLVIDEVGVKPIVGEIFGIINDPDYDRKRQLKIELSQKVGFQNKYYFWKWDAGIGEKLVLPQFN